MAKRAGHEEVVKLLSAALITFHNFNVLSAISSTQVCCLLVVAACAHTICLSNAHLLKVNDISMDLLYVTERMME